jgi:hypothetical protein
MNNFTFENAKTTFFTSKEDYLAMREAWKKFHRTGQAKGVWSEKEIVRRRYNIETHKTEEITCIEKTKSKPLSAEHYILYNLLRGKDLRTGFTPIKNEDKLNAHRYWPGLASFSSKPNPWFAFNDALVNLIRDITYACQITEGKKEWVVCQTQSSRERLLLPFGNLPFDELVKADAFLRQCLGALKEEEPALA